MCKRTHYSNPYFPAVQFFRGTLRFKNDFVTELNDETSDVFRKLHYEVRTAVRLKLI